MNIPKILFAVSGIFTAALMVKVGRDIDKMPDPRDPEKNIVLKRKIEADGPPKHMSKNTDKN